MKLKLSTILFLFAAMLGFTACDKKQEDLDPMRQFMPSGNISVSSGERSALLSWKHAINADTNNVQYKVIISRDSLFVNGPEFSYVTDSTSKTVTDENLLVRTTYYARVQTLGADSSLNSKFLRSNGFRITGEQIFFQVVNAEILDNAVILRWRTYPGLTKIVLTPATGTPIEVTLAAADVTAAMKTITGLAGDMGYTAEIFAGTQSKGLVSFRTKVPLTGANIIDLRTITGRPSVLADTIPFANEGCIIILKKGETYNIATAINLSKSLTFVSGYDFSTNLAIINLASNFNITAGSNIALLSFKDVVLRGTNYAGGYVFNVSNAATIGKLSFEGCRATIFRGMVRLQTAVINMTDFVIDNCVIDSVGNYGVVVVDNVNCKIDNIKINNTTIYKTEKIVTSRQNSVSCVISNCTFNEAPLGGGSNYLVDYSTSGTNNVTNGIQITNCLFGPGKASAGNSSVRGFRAAATTTGTAGNTYSTTDYVTLGNPFTGVLNYGGASTALFQDPANGNFKIIDNGFVGRNTAGDPRWRP